MQGNSLLSVFPHAKFSGVSRLPRAGLWAVGLGGLDQAVEQRAGLGTVGAAGEQPPLTLSHGVQSFGPIETIIQSS